MYISDKSMQCIKSDHRIYIYIYTLYRKDYGFFVMCSFTIINHFSTSTQLSSHRLFLGKCLSLYPCAGTNTAHDLWRYSCGRTVSFWVIAIMDKKLQVGLFVLEVLNQTGSVKLHSQNDSFDQTVQNRNVKDLSYQHMADVACTCIQINMLLFCLDYDYMQLVCVQ